MSGAVPLGLPGPRPARRASPLRLGALEIWPPVLLAPMSALTNLPMRTLAEELGCGLTLTEFLPAAALAARHPGTLQRLWPSRQGRAFGVQIYGRDPRQMAKAARRALDAGAALVDVNMGCPAKRVTRGACGAALMREPRLAAELVAAVVEAVAGRVPVSVKMRAGWDEASKNAPELAGLLVGRGAAAITVHGRTRRQRFDGTVDLELIGRVKRAVSVPVIANGDVVDAASMQRTLEVTGADGVMVGRAALGNPWVFAELRAWCEGHPLPAAPAAGQRLAMYLRHLELYLEIADEWRAVVEMRKFARWYLAPVPGGERLRRQINRLTEVHAIHALLAAWQAADLVA